MDPSHWLSQLRKGVLELLVLRLIALRGELHGYAIVKELLALGPLVAGESTVYPLVRRLEGDGLLSSRWVESESGPPRKYYRLSPAGSAFLAEAQCEWDSVADTISRLRGDNGNA